MLAGSFADLSAAAAAPPPPPPAPAARMPVVAATNVPPPPRIYAAGDPNVIPPVALNQTLPPFPGQVLIPRTGKLEVVIDESGAVESAVMSTSVMIAYDRLALAAARSWRFQPATVDGKPVKYRKVVQISIKKTS